MRRSATALLVCAILLAACSSGDDSSTTSADTSFSAGVGSTDLYAGAPQRFQIGVFRSTDQGVQLLTSGSVALTLAPFQNGPGTPFSGEAHYVAAPGTEGGTGSPQLSDPSTARGVYELDGTFDAPGVWQADLSFDVDGQHVALSTEFQVADKPALPAPSQKALKTDNLTMRSDVNPQAIDSRAQDGAAVPDPELHQDTIASAIAAHRAALVLFATPVYCQSQFCGPSTDALAQIAKAGPKDADYIHVEIWADYAKKKINKAAAQWLFRNGDLTEPWLYLIAPDGTIKDRWGPLFDPTQVTSELRQVAG
jgi:major membrane immunogen (membrane-anchored lipoprotein)